MQITKNISIIAISAMLLISGCARQMDSDYYTNSADSGIVKKGTVLSVRNITIKESDKLKNNSAGITTGGALGGSVGSYSGSGSIASTVGGAVAGAIIGSVAEDKLSKSKGLEYIIQLEKTSKTKTEEIISVIQSSKNPIAVGKKVFVIYSSDRARVIERQDANAS